MSTRVVSAEVLFPAAAALRDAAEQLDGAAEDIGDAGSTALSGAGQFAGELSEGAALLSLAWSATARHAGLSAVTIGAVAEQAVAHAEALDARATSAALGAMGRDRGPARRLGRAGAAVRGCVALALGDPGAPRQPLLLLRRHRAGHRGRGALRGRPELDAQVLVEVHAATGRRRDTLLAVSIWGERRSPV